MLLETLAGGWGGGVVVDGRPIKDNSKLGGRAVRPSGKIAVGGNVLVPDSFTATDINPDATGKEFVVNDSPDDVKEVKPYNYI